MPQPLGIDARAFGQELRRKLLGRFLVALHSHQRRLLASNKLMASHAVVFLDHPPAFLDIAPIIHWTILVRGWKTALLAAHDERGQRANLFPLQMHIGHAELFGLRLHLALIENIGLGEFVLEEAQVRIPRTIGGTFGQARAIFGVFDRLASSTLSDSGQEREVETLDRLAAFKPQLRSNSSFIFKTGNLMATRATKMLNPTLAFCFQLGIVHESRVR